MGRVRKFEREFGAVIAAPDEHRELASGEREENVVLEFRPNPPHDMLAACLRSFDERAGLYSFAAITGDPPA